jgi:hypothetical protein
MRGRLSSVKLDLLNWRRRNVMKIAAQARHSIHGKASKRERPAGLELRLTPHTPSGS